MAGNEERYIDESIQDFYKRRYREERERAEKAEEASVNLKEERDDVTKRFKDLEQEVIKRTEPPYA